MADIRVLIVEDDPAIGRAVEQGFLQAGHTCQWVQDGEAGLAGASTQKFDAVILDVMLPGLSGIEMLKRLRGAGLRMPVLLVTVIAQRQIVAGLSAGGLKDG